MIRVHLRTALLISFILTLLVAGSLAPAIAQDATPVAGEVTVLGPDESFGGATRGEWDARWWQWATTFPAEINPNFAVTDPTCGYGQSGPVFFLPANFSPEPVTMTCVVPEGTAIFVPISGSECSTVEPPPFFGRDEAELTACAEAFMTGVTDLSLTINGEAVPDLEVYQRTSPMFSLTFPEGNFIGVPPGVGLAVANSYTVIIAPPPPGDYAIEYASRPPGAPQAFTATYQITVLAPQVIEPEGSPEAATPVA